MYLRQKEGNPRCNSRAVRRDRRQRDCYTCGQIDSNKGSKNVMWDLNGDKAKIQGNSGLNVLRGVIGMKGFWSPYDVQEEDESINLV